MVFILQIILTIIAWRNGWGWISLMPILILFLTGVSIGLGISMAGGTINDIGYIYILDIISIIVLTIMCFKSPKFK